MYHLIYVYIWIPDFLTNRKQFVKGDHSESSVRTLNTGAPQGCVTSSVLFIIYTNNLRSADPNTALIKYADDTAVVGLISDMDESGYRSEIQRVNSWCEENQL